MEKAFPSYGRMGAGSTTEDFHVNRAPPFAPNSVFTHVHGRNLEKNQLGGVIFGCKNTTIEECLSKQLFGLPAQHFSYVKNIVPGLPLFLFNYSDRKIHGIFEATSKGNMYIDPHAWSAGYSERTQYPAQVKIRVRLQCQPLSEDKFRQIIGDNYYIHNHFWFELDHRQASKLTFSLVSLALAPGNPVQRCTMKYRTMPQFFRSHENQKGDKPFETLKLETQHFTCSSGTDSTEMNCSSDGDNPPLHTHKVNEKNLIHMKLKELSFGPKSQELSLPNNVNDTCDENNVWTEGKSWLDSSTGSEKKKQESSSPPLEHPYSIAKLMMEVEGLTTFMKRYREKNGYLEQKLTEATLEIQNLRDRCSLLESASNFPNDEHFEKTIIQSSSVELHLDPNESLFLIGGFDGESWLSSMDMYCPSQDVIKSLQPMSSVRSYSSVVQLNGEIYVFGGGNGDEWHDTVESYSPSHNEWTLCPPLKQKKGSLAGASLNNKIFVIGGGNGLDSFADVEMLDLDIGRWISTRSMQEKRFALAAAELNGVIYAAGGYNGDGFYVKSAERFDPREHSWTKIQNMSTKRGCHSMVVVNEKLYAIGGFDGNTMLTSIEVFDPRLEAWMTGEPMNYQRGYFGAAVINESIYVIGGVKVGETIVKTVENYKEGEGWKEICTRTVGKRCFLSSITVV